MEREAEEGERERGREQMELRERWMGRGIGRKGGEGEEAEEGMEETRE